MSPEANLKDPQSAAMTEKKPEVGVDSPPAKAGGGAPAATKKRSEAENVVEGHAEHLKVDHGENADSMRSEGRKFGFIALGLALALIGVIFWRHGGEAVDFASRFMNAYHARPWQTRILTVLGAIGLVAVVAPVAFYRIWMPYVVAPMGFVMTRVILSAFFFIVISPTALLFKVIGKDPLRRGKHDGSYWIVRDRKRDPQHFKHEF